MDRIKSGSVRDDEEIRRDHAVWEARLVALERKIDRTAHVALDEVVNAGMDRKQLIRLLALAASHDDSDSWKETMRLKKAALASVARRLETIASDAERQANDILSTIGFWAWTVGGGGIIGMPPPKPWNEAPDGPLMYAAMKVWAKKSKEESKKFGRFLRQFGQTDSGLTWLLVIVRLRTGSTRCFTNLANALMDAFKAAGKTKSFSGDGLRQVLKRHGRTMCRLCVKFHEAAPKSQLIRPSITGLPALGSSRSADNSRP